MNLEKICMRTIEIVEEAGAFIMHEYHKAAGIEVQEKGIHNYVTHVDKGAESILVDKLHSLVPEAGFLTEEGTGRSAGEKLNWIIDPLDGTTNYIHGAFPFAVSVALAEGNTPVLGVILELGFKECFYAWRGGGAYMNGHPIKVSSTPALSSSLVATGFPYTSFGSMEQFMKTIDWFMRNSRGLRRLGSAATDIAWVACGRYDGFYECGLNPWDVAAGVVILQQAGGICADFSGGENYIFGEEIICSNGRNHLEFVQVIHSIMKGS